MAKPAESDSFGRFFEFPLDGSGGELDGLTTLLADTSAALELGSLPDDFHSPLAQPTSAHMPEDTGQMLTYRQPALPATGFEVTAENNYAITPTARQSDRTGEASSSGGTQPGIGRGGDPGANLHRERNRAAQKKFRERQKARAVSNSRRMQELERRLAELMNEKKGLESKNKLLQHTAQLNATHYSELESQQEAFRIQQEVILMDTARIYRRGLNRPDLTLEDTKQFTMAAFLNVFEHFIGHYRLLLNGGGGCDPSSPAAKEVEELVSARRLEEARIALFSKWSSAALAWNREETASGLLPPSPAFYAHVLGGLRLSAAQQQEWLQARRRLLEQLSDIRQRRQDVALSLGLLLLQKPEPQAMTYQEKQLRGSLEEEREAVLAFLYTVIDCNMTPLQEAILDAGCYPWWPCLWTLCNLLAQKQKQEPDDTLSGREVSVVAFGRFSAAKLLREPLLARMGGLQLKRTIVSVALPENVLAAMHAPVPTIADMRDMTVFEVMCGKHLEVLENRRSEGKATLSLTHS